MMTGFDDKLFQNILRERPTLDPMQEPPPQQYTAAGEPLHHIIASIDVDFQVTPRDTIVLKIPVAKQGQITGVLRLARIASKPQRIKTLMAVRLPCRRLELAFGQ